jgi:hypothetical protein
MGGKEHGPASLVGKTLKEPHKLDPARKVEKGRCFIENKDSRLLRKRPGNLHFLPLTVTQFAHGPMGERTDTHVRDGSSHNLLVVPAQTAGPIRIGVAAEGNEREDRHHAHGHPLCEDQAQVLCDGTGRKGMEGTSREKDVACYGRMHA